jgi:hypothetical protein
VQTFPRSSAPFLSLQPLGQSFPKSRRSLNPAVHIFLFFLLFQALAVTKAPGQGFQNINVDFLRRNVVFIQVPCNELSSPPAGCVPADKLMPWGTGFLVDVPHKGGGDYLILVTARHMVDPAWTGCESNGPKHLHAFFNKAKYDSEKDKDGTMDETLSSGLMLGGSRTMTLLMSPLFS